MVRIGGEPDGDLELDRVGVLELVEQHADVPFMEQSTDRRMLGDQAAGEHQQVVELELARTGAVGGRVEHEPTDDRSEQQAPVALHLLEEFVRQRSEFHLVATQRLEGLLAGLAEFGDPLALRAG